MIMKKNLLSFNKWVTDLTKDERGSVSVKPVVAILGSLFLCVTMTLNSYSHADFAPSPELVNAVMIITAIGMGADTFDKFSHKKTEKKEEAESEI
jgi:hypothetical protein